MRKANLAFGQTIGKGAYSDSARRSHHLNKKLVSEATVGKLFLIPFHGGCRIKNYRRRPILKVASRHLKKQNAKTIEEQMT